MSKRFVRTEALRAPESLAQKNDRETRERHEAMRANALNHQMTRDVVEIFSGKVEDVRIKDID